MGIFILLCILFSTDFPWPRRKQINLPEAGLVRLGDRGRVPGIPTRWKGALEEEELPRKAGKGTVQAETQTRSY